MDPDSSSLPVRTTRWIGSDQHTLLRAMSALLPSSAERVFAPIALEAGSSVTLLHGPDRASADAYEALADLLRADGVSVRSLAAEPEFGKIPQLARPNLVVAVSAAVVTAAERCARSWAAPVLAAEEVHDSVAPLRLTMRPKPAMAVRLPGLAPDVVTSALRIDGSIGWSRYQGVPQRQSRGLLIEPTAAGIVVTHDARTRHPTTFRFQGPLTVTLGSDAAGEVDGRPHLFRPGEASISQTALPLYRIRTHDATTGLPVR